MKCRRLLALLVAVAVSAAVAQGQASADDSVAAMDLEELRALVTEQQQSIAELRTAVDDLAENARRPAASRSSGDETFALSERTTRLEEIVGDTQVGGWLDLVYADSTQDGQQAFFDVNHVYLYFDTRIDEHWQALAELEFEHAPMLDGDSTAGELKLERAYLQYNYSELLHARLGKFRTAWGYWTPVHWMILVDTIQKPIHEDNHYVPNKQVGIQLFGDLFDGSLGETPLRLEYTGWFSNGSEVINTNHPRDGKFGYGGDLRAVVMESLLFGFSTYLQHNPDFDDRRELSFMLYGDFQLPYSLTLRGEFMHQSRNEGFSNVWAGYAKLRWDFREDSYINYRFGIGDDDKRGAGRRHIENVLTLGYSPIANVRFRAEWAHNSFRASGVEDYDVWGVFAGIIF